MSTLRLKILPRIRHALDVRNIRKVRDAVNALRNGKVVQSTAPGVKYSESNTVWAMPLPKLADGMLYRGYWQADAEPPYKKNDVVATYQQNFEYDWNPPDDPNINIPALAFWMFWVKVIDTGLPDQPAPAFLGPTRDTLPPGGFTIGNDGVPISNGWVLLSLYPDLWMSSTTFTLFTGTIRVKDIHDAEMKLEFKSGLLAFANGHGSGDLPDFPPA